MAEDKVFLARIERKSPIWAERAVWLFVTVALMGVSIALGVLLSRIDYSPDSPGWKQGWRWAQIILLWCLPLVIAAAAVLFTVLGCRRERMQYVLTDEGLALNMGKWGAVFPYHELAHVELVEQHEIYAGAIQLHGFGRATGFVGATCHPRLGLIMACGSWVDQYIMITQADPAAPKILLSPEHHEEFVRELSSRLSAGSDSGDSS
ncbi:PH domain-containing protein [Candidatus Sumerlaeota bacterium]